MTHDVIVLGFGYAGAMAAISAADAGARVLLIEKSASPGGISICSAGGLRIADDADAAFAYLKTTCGGKSPDDVLQVLAKGMTALPDRLMQLVEGQGAEVNRRPSPANYPFQGNETFGFAYVEALEGFDPARDFPQVRGNPQGALLFRVLQQNVARRSRVEVRLGCAAHRLLTQDEAVTGVALEDGSELLGPVVLATGGFEANADMQKQYWPGGAALSAAYAGNTGDGIRMAQSVGADLWHMWHSHGCYGFALPGHPFGARVKRLPDWQPGPDGLPGTEVPKAAWILLDQTGQRFMNEYEPYMQDTGMRSLGGMDLARQCSNTNPAWFVTDERGLALYPMAKPTWNDPSARYEWSSDNSAEVASGLFRKSDTAEALAVVIGADATQVTKSLAAWSDICQSAQDPLGRPPSSLFALAPPFFAAPVVPVVSNTQGGPRHDAGQRVLDPFGMPIPGLWAAGECGSAFGHIYMSGGNIAECFVSGDIAGIAAAQYARETAL